MTESSGGLAVLELGLEFIHVAFGQALYFRGEKLHADSRFPGLGLSNPRLHGKLLKRNKLGQQVPAA